MHECMLFSLLEMPNTLYKDAHGHDTDLSLRRLDCRRSSVEMQQVMNITSDDMLLTCLWCRHMKDRATSTVSISCLAVPLF